MPWLGQRVLLEVRYKLVASCAVEFAEEDGVAHDEEVGVSGERSSTDVEKIATSGSFHRVFNRCFSRRNARASGRFVVRVEAYFDIFLAVEAVPNFGRFGDGCCVVLFRLLPPSCNERFGCESITDVGIRDVRLCGVDIGRTLGSGVFGTACGDDDD